jgi:hydroxymethylpyrimidine/phosphomethylpyrimidine kinase
MSRTTPVCLTIAGSDSGGGAGIQADLKAFASCGVHGTSAITAITAQSTVGVTAVETISPAMIEAQVRTVADDIRIDAVKLGMLADEATVAAVARALDGLPEGTPVVVDPVMVAESGARLLKSSAHRALVEQILPRASVATPNVPEARALVGDDTLDGEELARAVLALGPQAVVVTGGHREEATDVYVDCDGLVAAIPGPRHPDGAAHGSGCTHASALAANIALGRTPLEAARAARVVAAEAVRNGLRDVGEGPGPVDALAITARRAAATGEAAGDVVGDAAGGAGPR